LTLNLTDACGGIPYRNLGGTDVWGIAIGGEFWGGD